jgi:hypothetical protein
MEFNFEQNQKIEYTIPGVMSGTGKIVGCATIGVPILGRSYIIKPDSPISDETYPFSHFVCFENHLKSI